MIQWLNNIFTSLSGFFESITNGIHNIIEKIAGFFRLVGEFLEFLFYTIDLIPYHYKIYGSIILAVLIVLIIIGRESGGDS